MAKGRRTSRAASRGTAQSVVPDESQIYHELLEEALQDTKEFPDSSRPQKRRKPNSDSGGRRELLSADEAVTDTHVAKQVAFEDFDSPPESDFDWEDVGFQDEASISPLPQNLEIEDITFSLGSSKQTAKRAVPRKNVPAIERNLRIEIHKLHLSCQLSHVYMRNAWCNDKALQARLRPLLAPQTISNLNPSRQLSQFMRTSSLIDGLKTVVDFWKDNFAINALGLLRAQWVADLEDLQNYHLPEEQEGPMTKADFLESAETMEGSADTGAQLFCALLRSAGVDARLVCSLQLLPFRSTTPATIHAEDKPTIYVDSDGRVQADSGDRNSLSGKPKSIAGSSPNGLKPIQRFGQSLQLNGSKYPGRPSQSSPRKKRKIQMPQFPVYWVEVFNEAVQKWMPVDPLVTTSVNKASKFEPPLSSTIDMSYVISIESDGTLTDVTRRYTKAYNAKTRRSRLDSVQGGEKWLRKVFKMFDTGLQADRDQLEAAELAHKEASEPLPRNVQDFKDHPYYALERHLRQDEVIHPKREVGKFTPSKHASTDAEPIYRRRDVLKVRSADKWFRLGKELKDGEQPLRHGLSSRGKKLTVDAEEDLDKDETGADEPGIALYAEFQTSVYIPPPVVDGQVPRNAFGNLDVYVPSMIPAGAVHVKLAEASKAARILGIDYAEAVIGFEFKGRRGTAITLGVIIAEVNLEALVATIEGLWEVADEAAAMKQSRMTLKLWKRFMIGLRIRERVMGEDGTEPDISSQDDSADEARAADTFQEGGFMPDTAVETSNAGLPVTQIEPLAENGWEEITGLRLAQARLVPRSAIVFPPRAVQTASIVSPKSEDSPGPNQINGPEASNENGTTLIEEVSKSLPDTADDNVLSRTAGIEDVGGGFVMEDNPSQASNEPFQAANRSIDVLSEEEQQVLNDKDEAVGLPTTSDDASDAGSMLSHDPEDEDAEPEWLVEDV